MPSLSVAGRARPPLIVSVASIARIPARLSPAVNCGTHAARLHCAGTAANPTRGARAGHDIQPPWRLVPATHVFSASEKRRGCPGRARAPGYYSEEMDAGLTQSCFSPFIVGVAFCGYDRRHAMPEFEKRRIGRTSLEVAVLGLGCATLGGTRVPVTRQGAEAIVRAAWEAGVRYVDAAPYYGFGQAERAVGDALRDEARDDWVLSTKVG